MYRALEIMQAMERCDKPYVTKKSKHIRTAYIKPDLAKRIEKELKDERSKRV